MNNALLADIAEEYIPEKEGNWEIKDALMADWALDKIKETKAEYLQQEMVVKAKVDQLISWLEKRNEEKERKVNFFTIKLQQYFETATDVKKKTTTTQETLKLPSGTLKRKYPNAEYQRDDEKLVGWLKRNNKMEFIKVKESADWASLKKNTQTVGEAVVDENGEIIEGVTAIMRPPVFEVEV